MPRSAALGFAALVLVTALAPPGICPCWLLRDAAHIHPHTIDPGSGSILTMTYSNHSAPGRTRG